MRHSFVQQPKLHVSIYLKPLVKSWAPLELEMKLTMQRRKFILSHLRVFATLGIGLLTGLAFLGSTPKAYSQTSQAEITTPHNETSQDAPPRGLADIQHIVFIIKENRSFDHYFGQFPGVDGATSATISTKKTFPPAAMSEAD